MENKNESFVKWVSPMSLPGTLEMLVMLRFNRDLWDERDVDTVIARNYDNDTMMYDVMM